MTSYQRLKYFGSIKRLYSKTKKSNLQTTDSPGAANNGLDKIGPADELSNLRPIVFARNDDETKTEKLYRETREATQKWNQNFWSEHNTKFVTERKEFQSKLMKNGKNSVTADEMSVFYKQFLDKNWKNHLNYNISWYKQNIKILLLEIKVRLAKLKFK